MSNFDEFRFSFGDAPDEQKLIILRSEALHKLLIIKGFAEILRQDFEQHDVVNAKKPEEYQEWCSKIIDAAQFLQVLLDAIAFPQYREGKGLPELNPYDSLLDAIHDTARKLNLSLEEAIDDTSKIFVHSKYPLVLLDEPKYHREISFQLANSSYVVELLSYVDSRMFQEEYRLSLSTLNDVAVVINKWLLEKRTLSEIQEIYPLPQ